MEILFSGVLEMKQNPYRLKKVRVLLDSVSFIHQETLKEAGPMIQLYFMRMHLPAAFPE